jgi:hypothetical protein
VKNKVRDSDNFACEELDEALDVVIAEALAVMFPASSSEDYAAQGAVMNIAQQVAA